jgi:hypothetical protein
MGRRAGFSVAGEKCCFAVGRASVPASGCGCRHVTVWSAAWIASA